MNKSDTIEKLDFSKKITNLSDSDFYDLLNNLPLEASQRKKLARVFLGNIWAILQHYRLQNQHYSIPMDFNPDSLGLNLSSESEHYVVQCRTDEGVIKLSEKRIEFLYRGYLRIQSENYRLSVKEFHSNKHPKRLFLNVEIFKDSKDFSLENLLNAVERHTGFNFTDPKLAAEFEKLKQQQKTILNPQKPSLSLVPLEEQTSPKEPPPHLRLF